MADGVRYPTLKDVARLANTSTATVSFVLNGSKNRYISDDLRKRVLKAAKQLNYSKSALASALKGKNRKLIAVTVPQYSNIFFCRIVIAIEQIAIEHGYVLTIYNTFDDAEREKEVLSIMLSQRVDGFVFIPTEVGYRNYDAICRVNLPHIVVDRPLLNGGEHDFVTVDNLEAGRLAAQHLIDKGHTNIGYVRWQNNIPTLTKRLNGYQDALESAGIPYRPEYVRQGEFSENSGSAVTDDLLKKNPEITAVIYEEHLLALGGIASLNENNISVPDDISVVLIGSPDWAKVNRPRLTCIGLSEQEMGRIAGKMLFKKIEGTFDENLPRQITVDCYLEEGHSVKDRN